MPALDNPKHERFAQELAKGKSQADAYADAGYSPSEPHASRLASNGKVASRVREIQDRAAVRTEITVAGITANLLRIASKAEGVEGAPGLAVARAAQMDIAKLNGLVIDKAANANVSLEELLDRIPAEGAGEAAI